MKTQFKTTVAALGALAALAFPAGAAAGPPDYRDHLEAAEHALDRAGSLVGSDQARAALEVARANVLARKASRVAARIGDPAQASRGVRNVAEQFDLNAETIAALVDELRARFQLGAVEEVEHAVDGRTKAVEVLTDLLERVPEQAVPGILKAIAAVTSGGEETEELTAALQSGALSEQAETAVADAITMATAAIQGALDQLEALIGTLPAEAQPHVQAAFAQVHQHLTYVVEMLGGFFGGYPPAGGGSAPTGGSTPPWGGGMPEITLPPIPSVPFGPRS